MSRIKNPIGNKIDFESGGRGAIERLVDAYGFTTRQALADHLGVSKSTLANRYLRDTFPGDWIIQCALDTGASLQWLSTGEGPKFIVPKSDVLTLKNKKIVDGILYDSNYYMFDKAMVPDDLLCPISITDTDCAFVAEEKFSEITDGKWLVEVEGKMSIRDITRVPIGKVKVTDPSTGSNFECVLDDIKFIAKCRSVFIKKI